MGAQTDDRARGEGQDGVERDQGHHPAGGGFAPDRQQPVVAARAQPAHGPHRVAAPTVRDQPLTLSSAGEVAARLGAEPEPCHVTSVAGEETRFSPM